MKNNTSSLLGFTLVELLLVISIIGILATMGSMSYIKSMNRARDAKKVTETKEIQKALELYRSIVGSYPAASPFPTDIAGYYKGSVTDYKYTIPSTGTYCLCSPLLVIPVGNSSTYACAFVTTADEDYYCVESMQ